jgi:lysyl-tRNA synthetase class 2
MELRLIEEKYAEVCKEKGVFSDKEVSTAGRVYSIRRASKNMLFIDLKSDDGKIQVVCFGDHLLAPNTVDDIDQTVKRGDIIGITGKIGRTKLGQLTLNALNLRLLAPCLHMLPRERVGLKDLDKRFRQRYLDLIINSHVRNKFVIRSKVFSFLRAYLTNLGFIEVETPTLSALAGGAAAKPFKTFHNDMKAELFLRVAPELYLKQLVIGGMEKVFEIGKNFRNESIDYNHNPEFSAVEFYWAYADYNDVMTLTEDLLSKMVQEICGSQKIVMKARDGVSKDVEIDFATPWRRISIIDELEKKTSRKFPEDLESEESRLFLDKLCQEYNVNCSAPRTTARLIDKLVGTLIEPECTNPTFLMDHPQLMSPLAKPHTNNKGRVERFELFINQFEVVNSYTELNDPFEQTRQFEMQQKVQVQ